jgi:hypothetical protein
VFSRLGRLNLSTALVLAAASSGCKPELVVGKIKTEEACVYEGGAGAPAAEKVIDIGWSTGFENGSCDYYQAGGRCYVIGDSSYTFVDDPVHAGSSAGAFTVTTDMDDATEVPHTRCYLEGVMPTDATYGAWFYIPEFAQTGNWNLMFFQAAMRNSGNPALFSVSLASGGGNLHLYVLNHMTGAFFTPDPAPAVPIATWFQVEFRLVRATDATGSFALYQDRRLLLEVPDIITDRYDVHQWYVGNWADRLMPAESTVYVDDVTVSAQPAGQ